jgi:UDP-3-O-[3-hydroxymyristoyl] glucosamine N-acyltransferase
MATFKDVANALGQELERDTVLDGVSASSAPRPHTLSFVRQWSDESAGTVASHPDTLFIVPEDSPPGPNVLRVRNPRLAYALAVRDCLRAEAEPEIAATAAVAPGASVGSRVSIGHFAVIEDGVEIADGAVIDHHVVLRTGVRVGERTRIGSHTSIGGPGFGFEMDDEGRPVRLGHMGGVQIGSDVEIGSHVSIAQGTIEPTVIEDHVKIDDCVFIAHNVTVGKASFVIAGAEISGSVTIGERVWISPEVTVINKVSIGDDALVGIGAVVVKSVDPGVIVAGVPAKPRGPRYPA